MKYKFKCDKCKEEFVEEMSVAEYVKYEPECCGFVHRVYEPTIVRWFGGGYAGTMTTATTEEQVEEWKNRPFVPD